MQITEQNDQIKKKYEKKDAQIEDFLPDWV